MSSIANDQNLMTSTSLELNPNDMNSKSTDAVTSSIKSSGRKSAHAWGGVVVFLRINALGSSVLAHI